MTDVLSGKELVEKSYEYLDKLTRECAKQLAEEYNVSHRKFETDKFPRELGNNIVLWFLKRDKNLRLNLESAFAQKDQPNVVHLNFSGSTKDADFKISGTTTSFNIPNADGRSLSVMKTLVFSVDKRDFARRKS
jgi:hypothetical protein